MFDYCFLVLCWWGWGLFIFFWSTNEIDGFGLVLVEFCFVLLCLSHHGVLLLDYFVLSLCCEDIAQHVGVLGLRRVCLLDLI